jgi:hypothetical protein
LFTLYGQKAHFDLLDPSKLKKYRHFGVLDYGPRSSITGAVWCTIPAVPEGNSIPEREEENPESQVPSSRWEAIVWPRWLPSRARLPLIAQIAGAFALMAAVTMPTWRDPGAADVATFTPPNAETPAAPEAAGAPVAPVASATPARPAHLNLDLRHNFRSVDLLVSVDGKRALETRLEGSGKKFGVFGRREGRSFTRTLDLQPGARVVRLRVKSADEKFEHTRVERFDLGPASVATMRISIEKAGLSVVADRPAPPPTAPEPAAVAAAAPPLPPAHASEVAQAAAQAAHEAQRASALATLYQSLRSVLITLAGLIGSTATAFVVQEFLKHRKVVEFKKAANDAPPPARVRRRRPRPAPNSSDVEIDVGLS